MGVREETQLIRLKTWEGIINDRIQSGLTIKSYCEEHNISRDAYMYWLRQVRAMELAKKNTAFAELIVSDIKSDPIPVGEPSPITINIGRGSITVSDKESLKTVVEVLLNAQ